jgi:hypothetical protein
MIIQSIPSDLLANLRRGVVIPACPLALTKSRKWDEQRQKALIRYYIDAGVGGLAVGVHTTQFEIREAKHGLFEPVLKLASQTIDAYSTKQGRKLLKVAGVCGKTEQALREAQFVREQGYHAALLSLAALGNADIRTLIKHCQKVAKVMPLIGFYLQSSVGGRVLPYEFWRKFVEIENVVAIKMAPFNRYQTFDVIRAVCEAGREKDITLYTGNDDHIILDLLTEHKIQTSNGSKSVRIVGGLLGHWAVWTKRAVEQLEEIQCVIAQNEPVDAEWLTRAVEVTDANAAFFDSAHAFAGCIAGIHEVLRRQGLLAGTWCLNPKEALSIGQKAEIDRVYAAYPHLNDDDFVRQNLDRWFQD